MTPRPLFQMKRVMRVFFAPILLAATAGAAVAAPPALPRPAGPHPLGTVTASLRDAARPDLVSGHMCFSDAPFVLPSMVTRFGGTPIDAERGRAFFGRYLRGGPSELLDGAGERPAEVLFRAMNTPRLALRECTALDGAVAARCGTFRVREDRTAPGGREIDLNLVVVPAARSTPAPDPVFILPGGPGQVGTDLTTLVHRKGYGMANLDHGVPLSPTSVFYVASVSKQFTAAVAVLLASEGRISLDEDVRTYVPELPDYGKKITIRHLIHHTSGLRDYLELMNLAGMRLADVHTSAEVLSLIAQQRELNFAPGTEYLYSNTGYFLLSEITRRVSGKSLRAYADEKIFRPLGMSRTHFHDDRTMIVPGRVTSYSPTREGGFSIADWTNFEQVGSGGLHSSVDDLFRWDQNFYQNQLAAADLLPTQHTRGVLVNGDTIDYAFGLQFGTYRGLRTVRHGGSSMAFRTHLLRFPDQHFSAIVLCNTGTADPAALADRIADVYLADRLQAPSRVAAEPRAEARNDAKPPAPTAELLRGYTGLYHAPELGVAYTLTLEGNALRLRRPAAADMTLAPLGTDSFRAGSWTVRFTRDGQGRVAGFVVDAGRVRNLRFERRTDRAG